jgi:hypothetical protein
VPELDPSTKIPWPTPAPPLDHSAIALVEDVPWYKTTTYWGVIISVVLKIVFLLFKYDPGLTESETTDLIKTVSIVASFFGDFMVARGRNNAVSGGVARSVYFSSPRK